MEPTRGQGKAQQLGGIIKQATGFAAGDREMEAEGRADEAAGRADEARAAGRDAAAGNVTRQTTTTTTTTTTQNPQAPAV